MKGWANEASRGFPQLNISPKTFRRSVFVSDGRKEMEGKMAIKIDVSVLARPADKGVR